MRIEHSRTLPAWSTALVLLAFAAGCGDDDGSDAKTDGGESRARDAAADDAAAIDGARTTRGGHCGDQDGGSTSCDDGFVCVDGDCKVNVCGDGIAGGDDVCDDGNVAAGDGCDPDCHLELPSCGDGQVQQGEECDDGNRYEGDACTTKCTENVCGNGRLDGVEECDDGNSLDDDDCSDACTENRCRNNRIDPGEECDDGNRIQHDGCTNACKIVDCGNEKVEGDEECDDGNDVDDDDCSDECTSNECGNSRVDPGEVCDGFGCADDCKSMSVDSCRPCEEDNCNNYADFLPLVAGCFEGHPSPDLVPNPDPMFMQKCTDAVTCARQNKCGFNPDQLVLDCYCGSAEHDDCLQDGPADDAPCRKEWEAVTGSTITIDVIADIPALHLPSGWALNVIQCDVELCPDNCVP